jgi:hypothetical protein
VLEQLPQAPDEQLEAADGVSFVLLMAVLKTL